MTKKYEYCKKQSEKAWSEILKKDKKLETLTIKTEIGTKKKFLEYVDLYSRATFEPQSIYDF